MYEAKSAGQRVNFEHIMANVQLFWSVVESKVFALHLRELLWFITESPAIVDRDVQTCAPYESEKHLAALLMACAYFQ